jgi:ABC-type antimicrobial peptide transport system permease subunit
VFLVIGGYDGVEINAIIDTDYDERNNLLFDKIKQGYFKKSSDYYEDEDFLKLSNEIYEYLGYTYSLDPTYIEKAYLTKNFCSHGIIEVNGKSTIVDDVSPYINVLDSDAHYLLKGKKATMGYNEYNELFNTSYNSTNLDDFVPHTINFTFYRYYDLDKKEKTCSFELMIEGLYTSSDTLTILKGAYPEIEKLILEADTYAYSLYFDGTEGIETVLDNAESMNYQPQSFSVEGVHTMTKAVDVFIPIFELVAIFLCIGIIFILVSFSTKMIKDKMHDIGILKAIGTQSKTIGRIFGLQIILIAILTILMSTFGYYYFIDMANDVLIESLKRLAPTHVMLDLDFLTFKLSVVNINIVLILLLGILSLFIPMLKIRKIKPVKIIKTKE